MDDVSGESDVGLTIDESDSAANQNRKRNLKRTSKASKIKGKTCKSITVADPSKANTGKPKLKIKLAEKSQVKYDKQRTSTRIRKPRNLSPPMDNLKLKIKKPKKCAQVPKKRKLMKKSLKEKFAVTDPSQDIGIEPIQKIDIENLSDDDDGLIVIPAQTPVIVPDEPLIENKNSKKSGLKIKLTLGKVLKDEHINKKEKKIVKSIQNLEETNSNSSDAETRLVQPLKIKRTMSSPAKKRIFKDVPKLSIKTDHEPLTMKFSAGRVEFVETESEKTNVNLRWTVSPQNDETKSLKPGISNKVPSKNPFSEFHSVTKYPIITAAVSPAKAIQNSSNKLSPLSATSVLSSSLLLTNETTPNNDNMLFNSRFQSLLDTVSAELKEQEKIEACEQNTTSEENNLTVHSDLPTVEFPKQEFKFAQNKRLKKKSAATTTASLLKIKENVDVLQATDLSHIESESLDHMPERKRRKLLKRKELSNDYVDPDEVQECIPDIKQIKVSRRDHDPPVTIDNANKQHFNALLMPPQWSDEAKTDVKSKLSKNFNVSMEKKSVRTKKGLATTKQRLASKLKLSTKRGYVF